MSVKRRYNSKKIIGNLLWIMLGLATVVLLGAAISLRNHKRCKGVTININGIQNNFFIDKKEIAGLLENFCGGGLEGKALGSFNLSSIESSLRKNEWIKNAELFFDNNEMLIVDVTEREPIARIFTKKGSSFYIDADLAKLPLSDKTSARVPVFSDFPSHTMIVTKADSNLLKDIKNVSSYILNDPFWMAQIDQVDITRENTFEMIPKVGNQIIVFGNADNYQEKFDHLLTFYKQIATKVGWNKYSKINVQYKDQVVAVKRGTEDIIQDLLRTKQIMQNIAVNAQKQSVDSSNDIQLEQQQDDNIIPVAPQLEVTPDEQTKTEKPNPLMNSDNNRDLKIVPSSIEKPDPILPKNNVAEKKIIKPGVKPFWLKGVLNKSSRSLKSAAKKSTSTKKKSLTNEKPDPNPVKKNMVLKSNTKPINKPIIKSTQKIVIKPKAVMPPKNDY